MIRKIVVPLIVAVLALSGCAFRQGSVITTDTAHATPAGSASAVATPDPDPSYTPTVAPVGGKGHRYLNNVEVNVTKIERVKISPYASGGKPGDIGLRLTVMVYNGSNDVLNLMAAQINIKAGPDGIPAEMLFDFDQKMTGFQGTLAHGQKATAYFGFALPKGTAGAMTIQVAPTFGYDFVAFGSRI